MMLLRLASGAFAKASLSLLDLQLVIPVPYIVGKEDKRKVKWKETWSLIVQSFCCRW